MQENKSPYIIETRDVTRVYKLGAQEVPALRGVNITIEPGKLIALKGRSGSGKTTLLNCLGGLDRPTSGQILIYGNDLAALSDDHLTKWRREKVGFIFQSFGLLPTLSAYENVELMLRLVGVGGRKRHDRAVEVLKMVGLGKWIDHRPYELSGGQQQRVAVARALANRPQLILADEPTGELDSTTAEDILDLFKEIVVKENVTMLITSHDNLVEEYSDQVLRLQDGQIVVVETAAQ